MRNGFTFKGKHTGEFNVTVQTQSRPVRPDAKKQTYEAALMDGKYDFTGANVYGRAFYDERVFKYDIQVTADDLRLLQRKLGRLAVWLDGEGELTFDDTPNVKWYARVIDAVEYKPEHGDTAVLSVTFDVKPFAASLFDVIDGPIIDSDIFLDDKIPLDLSGYFTFSAVKDVPQTVYNIGDRHARPKITIENVSGTVTVECNGNALTVPSACVIDCEKQTVTDSGGNSLMTRVKGVFFELAPGANTFILSAAAKVTVSYEPKFMYDDNFDNIYLGDDNNE